MASSRLHDHTTAPPPLSTLDPRLSTLDYSLDFTELFLFHAAFAKSHPESLVGSGFVLDVFLMTLPAAYSCPDTVTTRPEQPERRGMGMVYFGLGLGAFVLALCSMLLYQVVRVDVLLLGLLAALPVTVLAGWRIRQVRGHADTVTQHLAQLTAQHQQLAQLVAQLPMGALVLQDGRVAFCNHELCCVLDQEQSAVQGASFLEWVKEDDRSGLLDFLSQGGVQFATLEMRLMGKDGDYFPARVHVRMVQWQAQPAVICLLENISAHKMAEEKIRNLAFFDPLTGLPNRRLMLDRLRIATAASQRSRAHGALMFIDLDNFKTLNDSRGHDVGDLLLKEVARRLNSNVRAEDTVARLGGDEFVVLLETLSILPDEARQQAEIVARKILASLDLPYALGGVEHHGSASMGVTLFQGQGVACDQIVKQADLAMYHAKFAGRATMRFFEPAMQAAVDARSAMEAELRRGIRQDEFELYYQPQVNTAGQVVGAEALVRWRNSRGEPLTPAQFIPLAEESGLILPMGRRILEHACARLAAWGRHADTAYLSLAVNVSSKHFRASHFVDDVRDALAYSGANPERLVLELAEEVQLDDSATKMEKLRALGVRFSLDHFGMGYSSLLYLRHLPIAQVKIAHTFIRDIVVNDNDAAIAKAIIAMAVSLNLDVVASGVETAEQWQMLQQEGCRCGQGYFFGRAVPAAEFSVQPQV